MWVRQCDVDANSDCPLPIPVVPLWTNYEFYNDLFVPRRQGTVRQGLVDLTGVQASTDQPRGDVSWEVATVDVEGGVA